MSDLYDMMCEDYRQKISTQRQSNSWRSIKSIAEAKAFIDFMR